jgi:multidrug efflux pump
MSKFFIDRPIFAWVIAIIIMLAGILSIKTLPVEQYPQIAPPTVTIQASYPGASAETLENSVTQVIEQRLTGIDFLRYFSSTSDSTGNVQITLTFEPEADPDMAQVQVQNKIQSAISSLPQEVQQLGVTVTKSSSSFLMVIGLYSKDGSMDQYAIGDYIYSRIADPIARVAGVGNLQVFGQPYAMRIWMNPDQMFSYNLTVNEITAALRAQNTDVSAGQLGGTPSVPGQQLNATVTAQSRLKSVEDFENILLKVNTDGSQVRLKDVASIELGVQTYDFTTRYNGMPATGMAVSLATGANALKTAELVKAKMTELSHFMPEGLEIIYPYDTTPFVKVSIASVVRTLFEAIILVLIIMFLFLQNIRATLITMITVPVVLLGTFAVLAACGYTINSLTMFAMILAIGLLVDDAIVVVENVERVMSEEGLPPKAATRKSMEQITGALVGIAMVLSAVFIPMAFFKGSVGAIYRQFSITIVSAMALSVVVALILTPALCATMLKAIPLGHKENMKGFFGWFNRMFNRSRGAYKSSVAYVSGRAVRFLVIYLIIGVGLLYMFHKIPTAFLPDEDQGIMFVQIQSPPGATQERTMESIKKVEEYFLTQEQESVESIFTVAGFSFTGRGQNTGIGFVRLKDWGERIEPHQKVFAVAQRAMMNLYAIKDAFAFAFYPPSIIELGNASGFNLVLLDRGGLGHETLTAAKNQLLGMASQNPELSGVRPNGLADVPEYKLQIDHEKASALGLSVTDINNTIKSAWGSSYINDFIHEERIKKVFIQGEAEYRMLPEDVGKWYVRNAKGEMVPFSAFTTATWDYGSPKLERYNGTSSQGIEGAPIQGVSSGRAMAIMEDYAKQLPEGISLEWTGISYEERAAGAQAGPLYALAILIVFLSLAALYESWSVPFAVMLIVPLGIVGTVAATFATGLSNDVYFQVAILTTIGLSAKNAILIVEFAKDLHEKSGYGILRSAMVAAEQRLRPIIMTSLAFILGVTPLALSTGAGAASQNAIGIGVIGGMLSATSLAILFVPMFFVLIVSFFKKKGTSEEAEVTHEK